MATQQSSEADQSSKSDKKGGSKKGPSTLAPTQDPIIITGGSITLEYAVGSTDGFDGGTAVPGKPRKRHKHKRNTGGKAELTRIEIYSPDPSPNAPPPPLPTPVVSIDLKALGIDPKRCQIRVHYDVE